MIKVSPFVLLFLSLWLGACGQTVLFELPYQLSPEQKVKTQVDHALAELWEVSILWGGAKWGEYHVGRALLRVLEDDPAAPVSIQYLSSDLQAEVRTVYPSWRVFQADYRLTVLARRPEGIKLVEAVGIARSTSNEVEASRVAIEIAIVDLARQVALLNGRHPEPSKEAKPAD